MAITRSLRTLNLRVGELGWPGVLGIGFAGAAVVLLATVVWPLRQENIKLKDQFSARSPKSKLQAPSPGLGAAEVRNQLTAFAAALPKLADINPMVESIHSLAEAKHLKILNSEYRSGQDTVGNLRQFHVGLRVEGSYPDLRDFLSTTQVRFPSVAIQRLTFSRPKISESRLEASLDLAIVHVAK